ncbi:glycine-rich domain-containing protein [Actinoplanes sp. RD1]|uniref:hypothetical protein n=1 Tax=Actinoplanes sp. RD1 TaxID=3064538 RepID=UPI0027420460|nr:hypothetical protein [Actinoplanes sp. RD1]
MTVLRPWRRATGRRVSFINGYDLPHSVRSPGGKDVEAGLRQWFRINARHPKAAVAMPSVVVGDLWQLFSRHTRDYDEFCTRALGRPLPYAPVPDDPGRLGLTWRLAREDERLGFDGLPLLFRLDAHLGVPGGRRYLADCGGRGQCYEQPGLLCLGHLGGPGRKVRGDWRPPEYKQTEGEIPGGM